MAKYRSPDKAVRVKTDTPMDTSFMNSERLQRKLPYGQYSTV